MGSLKIMIAIIITAVTSRAYAADRGDFQVWHTAGEESKISKDLKLGLEEEFRWQDNANDFFYHHYDVGVAYSLNERLDVGGGYRHIYEKKSGKFKLENEPYVTLAYKWKLAGLKFDDRSRLEYRHFERQTDSWRYRNKFTVQLPWKFTPLEKFTFLPHFLTGLTKLEIQPYFSDEIFLNFYGNAFTKNRFYSGLESSLTKNIKVGIYYLLEHTKNKSQWPHANVLGSKIRIIF